jgi:glutamate synthase domain-containing protein 3
MTMTIANLRTTPTSQTPSSPSLERDGEMTTIDCRGVYYRRLNEAVRAAVESGAATIRLLNVNGQRYIGTGLSGTGRRIEVHGTPGQAVAMFMDGPTVEIHGNAQDGVGNTMNDGQVIVHGSAGDVLAYGMRGGRVFVRGDVGYRAGIHMKAHDGRGPVVVCGGKARDFFGEYMAGGVLVLLGLDSSLDGPVVGAHVAAGMHGGAIYVRGEVEAWQHDAGVRVGPASQEEMSALTPTLEAYCAAFALGVETVLDAGFTRIAPASTRPYAGMYTSL